ncbi:auxin-responsive protein IAA1-like [Tasmannia lanceolata]|uniref:auxin-responsive protein IAA1-like n=1 Tax=Tasmannia lanceolata TaxID=3420 RepID=UPI004063008C
MSPVNDSSDLNFKETELTLGIPGGCRSGAETDICGKSNGKRGFSETVDLNTRSSGIKPTGSDHSSNSPEIQVSRAGKPPSAKAQVVGWPPVKSIRKNALKSCTYVKVAVDGAPYLRKVDLGMYNGYHQLLAALEDMFTCFTIRNHVNESKLVDRVNGTEYLPTYEDKDGDWMLVGDVPWKMFVESCMRLRLMKSSEAIGLAPRTPQRCTSTS